MTLRGYVEQEMWESMSSLVYCVCYIAAIKCGDMPTQCELF